MDMRENLGAPSWSGSSVAMRSCCGEAMSIGSSCGVLPLYSGSSAIEDDSEPGMDRGWIGEGLGDWPTRRSEWRKRGASMNLLLLVLGKDEV